MNREPNRPGSGRDQQKNPANPKPGQSQDPNEKEEEEEEESGGRREEDEESRPMRPDGGAGQP